MQSCGPKEGNDMDDAMFVRNLKPKICEDIRVQRGNEGRKTFVIF